jgi:hypothetical protein
LVTFQNVFRASFNSLSLFCLWGRGVELSNRSVDILIALLLHFEESPHSQAWQISHSDLFKKYAGYFALAVHATINERSHG